MNKTLYLPPDDIPLRTYGGNAYNLINGAFGSQNIFGRNGICQLKELEFEGMKFDGMFLIF